MADETEISPISKPKGPKSDSRKRELKSVKRKDGVPILKKPEKKSKKWWWIGGGLIVAFFAAVFLVPRIGTIKYGICKTFVELHDPYPDSLEYVQAFENDNVVTIDYNRTDSFGQRTLNQMRCVFKREGNLTELSSVDLNGKNNSYPMEAPEEVKKFNRGIPALLQNKPSLVMPKGMAEDIKDYRD